MSWFVRLKLRQKIALSTFVVIVLMTTFSWFAIKMVVLPTLADEVTKRGKTIAQSIRERSQRLLVTGDTAGLLDLIYTEKWLEPYVAYIFILDEFKNVAAHTFLTPFPKDLVESNHLFNGDEQITRLIATDLGEVYDTSLAVFEGLHQIGTVRVGMERGYIDRIKNNLIISLISVVAVIIGLAVFLIRWFSLQITQPVLKLSRQAKDLSRGEFGAAQVHLKKVDCWRIKGCERTDCPGYGKMEVACWLVADREAEDGTGEGDLSRETRCLKCDIYKSMVGDEIDQLSDAFGYMAYRLGKYQEELRESNKELRRANAAYINMLGFVSHELKAPIANSAMSARALLMGIFGDMRNDQTQMVELICNNLERSLGMVKNYLDLSRIEMGEMICRPEKVRLVGDVIEPVLVNLAPLIEQRGMRVEDGIPDDTVMEADPELLKVLYFNIISNACTYGKDGGVIRLTAQDLGDEYRVEVFNEGPGIPEDKMDMLFKKFSRIKDPLHKDTRGAGLGLFICKDIVERHRGRIWAESSFGLWIKFMVELPKKSQGGNEKNGQEEDTHH